MTAKSVIPAKAGIQKNTGFRVKPGMTNWIRLTNQSIIVWTSETKSLLPSLCPPGQRPLWVGDKREELPLFGKEGEGRFSEEYVFSISLKIAPLMFKQPWEGARG